METTDRSNDVLARFLDSEGCVKQLPKKHSVRIVVLEYLAGKFEPGKDYTEHEVNALLSAWHTFNDFFILRRELVEAGLICRVRDGSRYWKNADYVRSELM